MRIRRICSSELNFKKHALIKAAHFRERGYPVKLITEALVHAWRAGKPKPHPPQGSQKERDGDLNILVTTYHPTFNDLSKIVRGNWEILSRSSKTRDIHEKPLICSLRRPPNLKSQLVRARTDYHPGEDPKHPLAVSGRTYNICQNDDCRYCPKINKTGDIFSTTTKRRYTSKFNVSCQSSNLIYCITCKKCGARYVGQTKRRLMDRFQDHFYKISRKVMGSDIGQHFNSTGHEGLSDMVIHIVDFIHCSPESESARKLRNTIEKNWIFRLRTQTPEGLNLIDAPSYT